MALDIQKTTLAEAPYWDDFDESKKFHRVLFKPAVAVQARELSQLQTILQNQIERFGSQIFTDGSVVEGCSIEFISDLEFVGIEDQFINNSSLAQDDASLINAVIIGSNTDCQALLVATQAGFIRQNPGKFFIRYTKPGSNGETTFAAGETLNVYSSNTTYVEDIVLTVANTAPFANYVGQVLYDVDSSNIASVLASAVIVSVNATANSIVVNNIERRFAANDTIILQGNSSVNTTISAVAYDTGTLIGQINVLTTNTDGIAISSSDITGFAYGAFVSDGIIFNKGFFIAVDAQTVIVNPANNNPAGFLLGFNTTESIVTATSDSSLYDNALGYSNFNAPGADRLKLTANLISVAANGLSNSSIFFPIVEFSNSGVIFQKTDPQYSALGSTLADRTYEEAGHFIINPFLINSNTDPSDDNSLILNISPGLAYVKGQRIELLNNLNVEERRGTDTLSYTNQIVSISYGNYVSVQEVRGYFPTNQNISVNLLDTYQHGISNNDVSTSSGAVGNIIGTANLRELVPFDAPQGTPNAQMEMYLFNVKMSNSSLSFANVKAIAYTSGSANAFADVVSAKLNDSSYTPMIFSLGAKAVKTLADANGDTNSEFYYNGANTSASLASTGLVTFKVPSGSGILGFTDGSLSSIGKISLYLSAEAESSNLSTTTTIYANSVLTDTNLGKLFFPGEIVGHGANQYLVTTVIDDNTIKVANTTVAASAQTIFRIHQAGSLVAIDGTQRTLTWNANNQATINLGSTYINAPIAADVRFLALENQAQQLAKDINRSTTVLFSIANTGSDVGPWNLGLPDVLQVSSIYATSNNGTNIVADLTRNFVNDFVLDNGQRDGFYDHATLKLSSAIPASKYQGQTLLALVDHFTPNNTLGEGYFTVDSYPVDDTLTANTQTTIRTADIPSFYSSTQGKTYYLRDSIDFRPYKAATANIGNSIGSATLNPATTTSFNSITTTFTPFPGQNFTCNFTNYVGRKDVLTLTPDGTFVIVEGGASLNPRTPTYSSDSLSVAEITIPPYPSLPANEAKAVANSSDSAVTIALQNHRRYTMKDISSLDQRISQLEYYTTLNALESTAATMSVIGPDGTDLFKNGIFVDPFNNHAFGRVDVPQYRIAVDEDHGFGRPFFLPQFVDLELDSGNSNNVTQISETVMLSFTETAFITEQYATDSRSLSGSPPTYYGTLILHPDRWTQVEAQAAPVSVVSSDSASAAYAVMDAPPLCTNFGWWRQDVGSYANNMSSNSAVSTLRDKTQVGTGSLSTYSIDDTHNQSITIQPYLTPREIAFKAYGLKPYTTFNLYVDQVNMNLLAAPGDVANASATDDTFVLRSDPWGTSLVTNSRGEVAGKISLPAFTFQAGKHTVTLLDTQIDSVTDQQVSGAAAMFEVDILYQAPPPPATPPIPPKPPVTTPPTPAATPPSAKFVFTGNTSVNSNSNPVLTFKDNSVAGSNTITAWAWDFGDGSTSSVQNPPAHTYTMTSSSLPIKVALTVTDAAGRKNSATQNVTLSKLPAPPLPKPPTPPPLPTVQINAFIGGGQPHANNLFANGTPDGSGMANGVGSVGAYFNLVPSSSYTGAYVVWTVTVNSGNSLSNTYGNLYTGNSTPTQTPAVLVAPSNTQVYCLLTDTRVYSSSNPPLQSNFTVSGQYTLANGAHVTANTKFQFNVTPQAPSSGGGGGGCVAIDQWLPGDLVVGDVWADDEIEVCRHSDLATIKVKVAASDLELQPCYKLTTESGAWVIASASTTMMPREGGSCLFHDMLNKEIPVRRGDEAKWERVVSLDFVGERVVNHITLEGYEKCYWAGGEQNVFISTHNVDDGHLPYKKL